MNTEKIRGRCFCGSIHFQLTPPTEIFSHCHCESCRLSHGAAFVTWTSVPEPQFELAGGIKLVSHYISESGAEWGFCSNCGASMFYRVESAPGRVYITAANLIDPMDRDPERHMSFEERVDWVEVGDDLPKHRGKTDELME